MSKSAQGTVPTRASEAIGLAEVLELLPERELKALAGRVGMRIDHAKRIAPAHQVARVLISLPESRAGGQLTSQSRELLFRVAEAGGVLEVESLPAAVEPLVGRGLMFARGTDSEAVELMLPIAVLVQLRAWEGEDPRGVRALLSQVSADVGTSIASHYLGRTATPPLALALEDAWRALMDPVRLRQEVEALAPAERKLLQAIDELGGEVDTEELLDLEREPMRLRGATGATPSRRGVGFALERRAFLIPIHPNRHVIPTEVGEIVGARQRREREASRVAIRTFVLGEDHAPRRARFADDPVPLALGMALLLRETSTEVRPDVGTPKSLINKMATRFGREPADVAQVASLSRAVGLWDSALTTLSVSPGSSSVAELGRLLFEAWRRGGAWDEARPDGEALRVGAEAREASAVGVLRGMVLDALRELGEGRWVPWEAIAGFVRTDPRTPGVARLIERWAGRAGVEALPPTEIARRIAMESLHVLGAVDLGDVGEDEDEGSLGPTLRITPRGRRFLGVEGVDETARGAHYLDNHALRIGADARVGNVLALAQFVEVGRVAGSLDVSLTASTVSRAVGAGHSSSAIRAALAAIAPIPDPIERIVAQASAVLGRAEFVPSQGFLWVDDPEVRELLRTRRQTADLFVDPSPPGGLLIGAGVDLERVARRCRALGVEVVVEGATYRTRSTAPPPRRSSTPADDGAAPRRRASGTRRAAGVSQKRRKTS